MAVGTPPPQKDHTEASTITRIDSAGVSIALHDFGGQGPPLVISHATGFHARTYLPLIETLRTTFTVWGVDLRAHGHSPIPESASFVWHDFAGDLLAAIDEIRVQSGLTVTTPVVGFGHSMGGTTILLAEQMRPGTIAAAWLFEPIVFPADVTPRNSMMAAAARKRRAEFPSRAAVLERYSSRPPLDKLRADALAAYVNDGFQNTEDGTVTLRCQPIHEAMTFDGAKIEATSLADIAAPVLIAQGESVAGQPSAADFAPGTAAALANAEHCKYDHLGHFGPLEAPERVATDMVDWFTSGGYCSR